MDENSAGNNTSTLGNCIKRPRANGRWHDRLELSIPLQIISHGVLDQKCVKGISLDISEDGVGFLTDADLDLTNIVELIFESKVQPAFRTYARLIYRFGPRYGAYFLSQGPNDGNQA